MSADGLQIRNLLASLPQRAREEDMEVLLSRRGVRLKRIVSYGHVTAEGEWYDQDDDEWVVVLSGAARLLIEGEGEPRAMGVGDAILIPAHVRHRVTWTDPAVATVWLAVHVGGESS